eukprot:TRINITY_DN4305_c0_g1_i1.p1 TRINITY_DN4305_c0_g1~~TRINITY_DN4305_c0_g1_i1.p1  ORF type:complete len:376 (-),score=45.60 TRINITY_DN4305_c0_g1_i1:166-1293(-)
MNKRVILFVAFTIVGGLFLLVIVLNSDAPSLLQGATAKFQLVVIGSGGPLDQTKISSFLVAPLSSQPNVTFLGLDGGTSLSGIREALSRGCFREILRTSPYTIDPKYETLTQLGYLYHYRISTYFFSRAKLDRMAGWLLTEEELAMETENFSDNLWPKKSVVGLPQTLSLLKKKWPLTSSFTHVTYENLPEGTDYQLPGMDMTLRGIPLGDDSSALLIQHAGDYLVYIGGIGPDTYQNSTSRLLNLWKKLAPLLDDGKLRAIIIECAYTNEVVDGRLKNYLTPRWLMFEMHVLNEEVKRISKNTNNNHHRIPWGREEDSWLRGQTVLVTRVNQRDWLHRLSTGRSSLQMIEEELNDLNTLGISFVYPKQAQRYTL